MAKKDLGVAASGTNDVVTAGKTQTLTNKTLTSPVVNTPTGIVKGDVGLGNVDNTSDATKNAASVTLTNKRISPRITSLTSSGTPTPSADTDDVYMLTAQTATAAFVNPTGTPVNGQMLQIRITGTATRAVTWGSAYAASDQGYLISTTVGTNTHHMFFVYDTVLTKWVCTGSDLTGDGVDGPAQINATQTLTNKTLTTPTISATGFTNMTHTHLATNTGGTLTSTTVGLSNVDNTSDATKNSATATLTNKRITARVASTTSSATPTPNADTTDLFVLTAQTATAAFVNPTGTPTDGQELFIRITGTAARAVTWGTAYISSGMGFLISTTVTTNTHDLHFKYNAVSSKWVCLGSDIAGDGVDIPVTINATQTLTAKTLTTPIIADHTNATHTHASTAQGGLLGTVLVAQGGTGAATLTGVLKGNGTSAVTAAAQLAVADGGTGAATLTGVLKGNGTSAVTAAAQLAVADGGTGAATLTGMLKGNGTSAFTAGTAGSDYCSPGATQTLTATRIQPRVVTTASSGTPTPNADTTDHFTLTAQAATAAFATPTGTPTDGQKMMIRITGTAARAITWSAGYASSGVATLPSTTVTTKTHHVGLIYDSTLTKWVCIAVDAAGY